MKLGEKIKILRTEKGLTQPELAVKARIEQSYLSKLENDKGNPSFDIINRIATALDTTAMDLIHSLSQSYVECNLLHLPEISAEFAIQKKKAESVMKMRFILAAFLVVIGSGTMIYGFINFHKSHWIYKYESKGIIKPDENNQLYSLNWQKGIGESIKERDMRISKIKKRFNITYKYLDESKGRDFIEMINDGRSRRFYEFKERIQQLNVKIYLIIFILGFMLMVSGFMTFRFNKRFNPY